MSQMTVKEMDIFETTSSPQQKQHWLVEQMLSWSGLPVVEVRPTAFLEGLFLQLAGGVATLDRLLAPLGAFPEQRFSAERDVALLFPLLNFTPFDDLEIQHKDRVDDRDDEQGHQGCER